MGYRLMKQTDEYRDIVNIDTGQIRRVPMASDKQWAYLNNLRADAGKDPIKNRPAMFQAKKAIDKLLAKKSETERQQRLI